jgi:phosphoserine phosphatase
MATQPKPRLSSGELESLLAVTRRLAAPFQLSAMLAEVTAAACRVLHAERASVWLLDPAANELVLEIASDVDHIRIPLGHGLSGTCARDRAAINVPDCYADPRFDPSVDRRTGFHTRCSLTLPLLDHEGALVGVMQVLNKLPGGSFGAADLALAEALAAQCAVALSRARMTAKLIAAERVNQQLDLARVVQRSALPRALPQPDGYELHAVCLPAAQTGGDTYDLALLHGALLVMLADAAGHGMAPALSVMQMQAMQRMAFRMGAPLETVFRSVNDQLAEILPDGHFVTAFIGLLDLSTHRLQFLSGGQSPILHYVAANDVFVAHKATSFPMGAMPLTRPCTPLGAALAPGDMLVLLSDGIYEYEDAAGAQFGRARVEQALREHRALPPADMCARLLDEVQSFAAGASQEDDITMVLIRRKASA